MKGEAAALRSTGATVTMERERVPTTTTAERLQGLGEKEMVKVYKLAEYLSNRGHCFGRLLGSC